MAQVTYNPYEVLARVSSGQVYLHVRKILSVDGVDMKEMDPEPLAGQSDPIFVEFATLFNATAVAERDALVVKNTELTNMVASLKLRITHLDAQLAEALSKGTQASQ